MLTDSFTVETLRRRLERAQAELEEQTTALDLFSEEQRERVPLWREAVLAHELDQSKPNPYGTVVKGVTEAEVRLRFAEEEDEAAAKGVPSVHDVSPSSFITAGLDLEGEQ